MKAIKNIRRRDRLLPLLIVAAAVCLLAGIFLYARKMQLDAYTITAVSTAVPTPVFSVPSGIYDEPFMLAMEASDGYTIYYTTDGSIPTVYSHRYRKPVAINPHENPNSGMLYVATSLAWRPPFGRQGSCAVIRARCFKEGGGYGDIQNAVYSPPEIREHGDFRVVHLLMEADSLLTPTRGIYVLGEKYYSKKARVEIDSMLDKTESFFYPANYHERGRRWQRPAELILPDTDGKLLLEQSIRVCIHGMASRANTMKSLRLMADSTRGDGVIHYPFFGDGVPYDRFNAIILRNAGNDMESSMFRDAMMTQTVKQLGLDIQDYAPAVAYINGNYWGIHNIRERVDEHYLATRYGAMLDDVEMLEFYKSLNLYWGNGQTQPQFEELVDFIRNNPMTDSTNYRHVCRHLDVDNFIDYVVVETFFANLDWGENNIRFYRMTRQTEMMKQHGIEAGRWRWIFADLDYAMYDDPNMNMFDRLRDLYPDYFITVMLFGLLENTEFRHQFVSRYEHIVHHYLTSEQMLRQIDTFATRYRPEMERHIARWRKPMLLRSWEAQIEQLKEFAQARPVAALDHLKKL